MDNKENVCCDWVKYFDNLQSFESIGKIVYKDLPIDHLGKCLFHSSDIEWKYEKKFQERLTDLINSYNDNNNTDENPIWFHNCIFIGANESVNGVIKSNDDGEIYTENNGLSLYISNSLIDKPISFFKCKFINDIDIFRCLFKKDLHFADCTFLGIVRIVNSSFGGIISFGDCNFLKELTFNNYNKFYNKVEIVDSTFNGYVDFDNVECLEVAHFEDCKFNYDYVGFNANFNSGILFKSNFLKCRLLISKTLFKADSLFFNNTVDGEMHLEDPYVIGKIFFVGTENNLLFNSHTILELEENNFDEKGHITFDYCNILNLGNIFISSCKILESKHLIKVNATCKVERLTIIYEYQPYSRITSNILEDLMNIITRYFEQYYSIDLNVDIVRDRTISSIKVIFKTTDEISDVDFKKRLKTFPNKLTKNSKSAIERDDLILTINSLFNRLSVLLEKGIIDNYLFTDIVTVKNNIPFNNIKNFLIMAKEVNFENVNANAVITGGTGTTVHGSNVTQTNYLKSINFLELDKDLSALKVELEKRATTDEHFAEIEIIDSAQKAIQEENHPKAIENLKKAGVWVLETAKEIGVGVATAVLTNQMGM